MGMIFFADKLCKAGYQHDHTKISDIEQFHADFKTGFKKQLWWNMHQQVERHHLKDINFVQDDVNLIDVLECITDGVMAGMGRTGEYHKEDLPEGLLEKAFDNTVKLLLKAVELER